jgi:hypothetical protein
MASFKAEYEHQLKAVKENHENPFSFAGARAK